MVFPESKLAKHYLKDLKGIEIGASSHNPFNLNTINVDSERCYKNHLEPQVKLNGTSAKIDVFADACKLPFQNKEFDFVINSHVLDRIWRPDIAIKEWCRVAKHFIFLIVPHKNMVFRGKPDTSIQEILSRPVCDVYEDVHHNIWTAQSFSAFVKNVLSDYVDIVHIRERDDKVGNGFCVVLRIKGQVNGAISTEIKTHIANIPAVSIPTYPGTAIFIHVLDLKGWQKCYDALKEMPYKFALYASIANKAWSSKVVDAVIKEFPSSHVSLSLSEDPTMGKLILLNEWMKNGGMEDTLVFIDGHDFKIAGDAASSPFWSEEGVGIVASQKGDSISGSFCMRGPILKKFLKGNLLTSITSHLLHNKISSKGLIESIVIAACSPNYTIRATEDPTILSDKTYGVNLVAMFGTSKGISEAPRQLMTSLSTADIPVVKIEETKAKMRSPTPNPYFFNILSVNADQTPRVHQALGKDFCTNRYTIGLWFWELLKFPTAWEKSFDYIDELWVASQFCYDIFKDMAEARNKPIRKISVPIIGSEIEVQPNREKYKIDKDCFVFLFVFDCDSLFERKNPLAIIDALKKAFPDEKEDSKKVKLIIKASHLDSDPENKRRLYRAIDGLPILLIDHIIAKRDVINLMKICDCYVSLHRSEGYGLTIAEAMLMGKPCIGTAYSGSLEFMKPDNSYLVDYKMIPLTKNVGPYEMGAEWADPNIETAVEMMKHVYANRDEARAIGEKANAYIKENFSYEKVGEMMSNRLQEIYNQTR